jgi:pyruvate kinase
MIAEGVNCFRINLSHGTQEEKESYFKLIRSISIEDIESSPSILADLAGPKVRVRKLDEPIILEARQSVTISSGKRGEGIIPVSKGLVFDIVEPGSRIMINDGKICLKVIKKISDQAFECKTIIPGKIKGKKGVNFIGVTLDVPSLTPQDEADLELALKNGADWIALSFTRSKDDYTLIKSKIKAFGYDVPVMAKVEKWEAVQNLDDIINVFDGVMVARGDLGVELPLERVPVIQKDIIKKAGLSGKPVIIATQMLDSMIKKPIPTRAEVSDIANSIIDGADALLVTGETAVGDYPKEVISMLSKVIQETEKSISYNNKMIAHDTIVSTAGAISHAACTMAKDLSLNTIVTMTQSGSTARMVSSFRPSANIYAMTTIIETYRALSIIWGVIPILVDKYNSSDEIPDLAKNKLRDMNIIKDDEKFIITGGVPVNAPGTTNYISVL